MPENVEAFVFRGPSIRRLSAEQFVDALSTVTGVWYDKPAADLKGAPVGATTAPARTRAALTTADPLTTALGRPNREQVLTVRVAAATTLQALELSNGQTLAERLQKGAARLLQEDARVHGPVVDRVYRRALGRAPTRDERTLCATLLGPTPKQDGVEDLLWSLVMLPEFQLIY